jgi:hypothetical protein
MEYAQAKNIRAKSFGTMLGEADGGLGASLKSAISQKTQAKMAGIKETFDPMNIAKFMTGGSNWAPALLGKLTGRKQSSIDYFSGVKRRKGSAEKLGAVGSGGGDFLGILQSIESLLHTTREEDKLEAEKENNFAEEKALEKARRHKELMEALTGKPYKEKVVPTATKEDEPSTPFDVPDLSLLRKMLKWFGGPVGLALLGVASMAAFFGLLYWGLQELLKITPNMKALSPEEATNALMGDDKQIDKEGGREYLEDIVKNGKNRAIELLKDPEANVKEILEMGGLDKVKKIAEDEKVYEIPARSKDTLAPTTTPKDVFVKNSRKRTKKAAAEFWDKEFGPYYNDDGTRKSATPVKSSTGGNEQFKKEAEEFTNKQTSVPPVTSESSAAVTENPAASQKLNSVQAENLQAKIEEKTAPGKTIVNTAVAKSAMESIFIDGPLLPVRNLEESYQDMIFYSTRIV